MIAQGSLITPVYKALQVELHGRPNGYGGKGDKWAQGVLQMASEYGCTSVLDYGCGQGSLARALLARPRDVLPALRVSEYDPAVSSKAGPPTFADLVVCTDVLEHVEPDCLEAVLAHLRLLARKAVFVVVATRPSNKTMADGRNAHLILADAAWWAGRLAAAGFTVQPEPPKSPLVKVSREWVAVLTP